MASITPAPERNLSRTSAAAARRIRRAPGCSDDLAEGFGSGAGLLAHVLTGAPHGGPGQAPAGLEPAVTALALDALAPPAGVTG